MIAGYGTGLQSRCRLISTRKRRAWNASTPRETGRRAAARWVVVLAAPGWAEPAGEKVDRAGVVDEERWKAISDCDAPESMRRHQPRRYYPSSWRHDDIAMTSVMTYITHRRGPDNDVIGTVQNVAQS